MKLWLEWEHLGGEYRKRREGDLEYPGIWRLDEKAGASKDTGKVWPGTSE